MLQSEAFELKSVDWDSAGGATLSGRIGDRETALMLGPASYDALTAALSCAPIQSGPAAAESR
jgi:hypothetical protein